MLLPLQAAQAKEASARAKEALEVSCMESDEIAAELRRTQECLTTIQAEAAAATQACDMAAVPGASLPDSRMTGAMHRHARACERVS